MAIFMEQFETQRQSRTDLLTRFFDSAKGIDALEGKSVTEVFANDQNIRDLIDRLSEKQFMDLINGLNGIIRGAKRKDWVMSDQQMQIAGAMESETVTPPATIDRPELLSKLFRAAKEMNEKHRTMEDIGLLLAVTLNAIHPWEDANGRTTRLLYTLIAEGYSDVSKDKISNLMSEYGTDELATDTRPISRELEGLIRKACNPDFSHLLNDVPTKDFAFPEEISENTKKAVISAYKADGMKELAYAASNLLKNRPEKEKYYRDFPNGLKVVMFDELVRDLSNDEISALLDAYFHLKTRKVELLIDAISHPGKPEYQTETREGVKTTVLEKLRRGVQNTTR